MKKKLISIIVISSIIFSGCGERSITVTGDNATITTNTENNNAQTIVDTDVNPNIDISNDKSTNNTNETNISDVSIEDDKEYQQLKSEYDQLEEENNKLNNRINELESKDINIPVIEYKNLGLSIDGENIPINKSNSMLTIDGRDYVSKEIAEKLISDNQNLSINDDTIYIGKIISEKANLFDKHVNDQLNCSFCDNKTDSYGNMRSNVLYFNNRTSHYIIFTLNENTNPPAMLGRIE